MLFNRFPGRKMIHLNRRKIRLVEQSDFVALTMHANVTQQHAIEQQLLQDYHIDAKLIAEIDIMHVFRQF